MFFQKFLKGIPGDDDHQAQLRLRELGICCRWWDRVHQITPSEIKAKLTERNLDWHLNRYDHPDPDHGGEPFYDHTPFISTTAGAVERDEMFQRNRVFSPFLTALDFATRGFREPGYIFYGYVYTLGKKSIPLQEFSEEVRELNIYTNFLPFHYEGEIVAKIGIPSVNLEKYEKYDPDLLLRDLANGGFPTPIDVAYNDDYAEPERYLNLRGLLER